MMKKILLMIFVFYINASYSQNYKSYTIRNDKDSCEICTCSWCKGSGEMINTIWVSCYNCKDWASSYRDIKGCDVCKNNKGKYEKKKETCFKCNGYGKLKNNYYSRENIAAREEEDRIVKKNVEIAKKERKKEEDENERINEKIRKGMSDPVLEKQIRDQIQKENKEEADRLAKEKANRNADVKANRNPVFVDIVKYAKKEITKSKYEFNFKKPLTVDFFDNLITDNKKEYIGLTKLKTINSIKVKCKDCDEYFRPDGSGGYENGAYSIKISGDGGTITLDKIDGERFQIAIDFFDNLLTELHRFGQ